MFGEVWCPSRGKRPYIIITNGLTGSGKSSLVDKVVDHYALCLNNQTFRIDDLIQTNTAYKKSIDRLVEGRCTTRTLCDNLKQSLVNPSPELYKEFGDLYFYHRGDGNSCGGVSCDDFLDSRLNDAIETHQNIVFETVGVSYAEWLINMVKPTHEVYYAFTLMDFQTTIERNRSRALQQTRQYLSNPHLPAPRLPDLSFQHFLNSAKAVNNTLKHLLTKYWGVTTTWEHVVVFDNTTYTTNLLYDSTHPHPTGALGLLLSRIEDLQNIPTGESRDTVPLAT